MNSYELSRFWFDFCFENPEKIKPNHSSLYFFCIEHCNRLGWKSKFGLPTTMAKEAIGIKSYNTYINTLSDLVEWGFIKMIEKSKNQYSANIIALSKNDNALNKALDKALVKHASKQSESTHQSIDSIIKQLNKEQLNKKQVTSLKGIISKYEDEGSGGKPPLFDFKSSLISLGVDKTIASDWLKVRAKKKASNTETAFSRIKAQIEKCNIPANDCIRIAVEKSWSGFEAEWLNNQKPKQKNSTMSVSDYSNFNPETDNKF